MRLCSEEDWEGLREDVAIAQKAKKDGGNIIVEIILDTDVSSLPLWSLLFSLICPIVSPFVAPYIGQTKGYKAQINCC